MIYCSSPSSPGVVSRRTVLTCCHCSERREYEATNASSASSCRRCSHDLCRHCRIRLESRLRECWACGTEEPVYHSRRARYGLAGPAQNTSSDSDSESEDEADPNLTGGPEALYNGPDEEEHEEEQERCGKCGYPVEASWIMKWGGAGMERWGEVLGLLRLLGRY